MSSPDYSDGCMIALYPPPELAADFTVDGGLPTGELHVTVAYVGNAEDVDREQLLAAVKVLAERAPIAGSISGHARFTGGEMDVAVALVDSASLEDLRRDLLDALAAAGIEIPRDHGYTSHLTQSYIGPDDEAPVNRIASVPVEFAALSVVHGTGRTDLPFEHPIEAPAREAFAAGWAVSGGPMTDRVRAGCTAAVQLAVDHAHDPRILEVTIDLGKLEGMWALLFQRREEQLARHTGLVATAWRELITRDSVAAMVDQYRQRAGLTEGLSDFAAEALAAAKAMLQALADLSGWTKLRGMLQDAIRAGRAEGMVNAVAIAAENVSRVGLDWNIGFQHAYDSLERLDEIWADADGWLGRTVDRAAADLGRTLAQGAEDGASRDEMIDAAMDVLASDDVASVAFVVDWAMTTAADEGALSLYRSEGVQQIDVITVGDDRVCDLCLSYETASPWDAADVPRMPTHPRCRCCYSASVNLASFAAWFV
ncbi:2'-5' RNA ligase family protein [Streptomyces sp. NPDC020794]|uniref:2'-5' RNA ligase family protein n=1 Tax=unclassified Streptomyces TaxID=2593676 RepID=UPI0036E034B5